MTKKDKIEITGLNIKLGKVDLTLTPVEAKELYRLLGEIFEKETIVQMEYVPRDRWYYPYWGEIQDKQVYGTYTVYCNADNQTLNISDSATNDQQYGDFEPGQLSRENAKKYGGYIG